MADLEDLLNDALDDFDIEEERAISAARPSQMTTAPVIPAVVTEDDKSGIDGAVDTLLQEIKDGTFVDTFTETLGALTNEMGPESELEPELLAVINQMFNKDKDGGAKASTSGKSDDLFSNMEQTMKMLSKTATDLKEKEAGGGSGEGDMLADLMKSFDQLGNDAGFQTVVEDMMKSMLSREVLEPAVKDMKEMYPTWLEDNKEHEEYERYFEQYKIVEQMDDYFKSIERDGVEYNPETVMTLFTKLHELGQPPDGIVNNVVPGLEFDEQGMPKIDGLDDKMCSVM